MNIHKPVNILLIEDDPGHVRLVEKNLRRANVGNSIVVCSDGKEAVDLLFDDRRRTNPGLQEPLMVLLDLNMPVMDGYQVLSHLKADPRTVLIPVIVLTTTDDPEEIQRCYDLGCNAYVVKSADYEEFTEAMRRLGLFLTITRMPREAAVSGTSPGAPFRVGLAVSKPSGWSAPVPEKDPHGTPG